MNFASLLLASLLLPQTPPSTQAAAASVPATFYLRNTTRIESWNFFESRVPNAQHEYTFIANRLHFGVRHTSARWEAQAAGQYVQFSNLPPRATGPGPLGSGGAYYDASRDAASHHLYLKYLNVKLKRLVAGLDVEAGRFGYTSGAEMFSGVPAIESVKRQRVDSRMIGEFEWSLFQRSFDGARADWRNGPYRVTGAWIRPTQGGFEEDANVHIPGVNVEVLALTAKPGTWVPYTETQAFFYRYDDSRDVSARPDNSGKPANSVDVGISTFGATLVSAVPAGSNLLDGLFWFAGQTGDWYGQRHRAWAFAAEAGYQWPAAAWKPWVRGGLNLSSGDGDPSDASHHTFFQMLPTARKYSQTTVYTQMNLRDVFVQLLAKPTPKASLRLDVHDVSLANGRDRWYFGSGVTQKDGVNFGYGTRPSLGSTDLGVVLEGSVDYAITPHWSVNAFAARIRGGDVVRNLFAGESLSFLYLETIVQF